MVQYDRVVDCHIHLDMVTEGWIDERYKRFTERVFKRGHQALSLEDQVKEMRQARVMGWLLAGVGSEITGLTIPKVPSESVMEAARKYPDLFIPFVGVDPNKGKLAEKELRDWIDQGAKGLKILGYMIKMYVNDPRLYPLYDMCQQAGLVVSFHLGHAAPPNTYSKYGQPIYLDDVAVDFPDLTLVGAHAGFPWMDEMYSVCWKHENVYCDIGAWMPRYLPPSFIRYMDGPISHKVLFGTDWPSLPFQKVIDDLLALPLKDERKERILWKNAMGIIERHKMLPAS